jgi:hypothetical protein
MTTSIAREGLVRFLEATGHPPRIAALGEEDGLANRIANPPADPI